MALDADLKYKRSAGVSGAPKMFEVFKGSIVFRR